MVEHVLGTGAEAEQLSDVDVWIQLTLADMAECPEPGDEPARFSQDTLIDEIARRWGKDALERVATVITGGKFSQDDELRWLRGEDVEEFMRIVRGELTPDQFFASW
jgi:hypothetical protein